MSEASSLPQVSVIIPVYDASRYVAEAVASALAQTDPPCEVIVVNDGCPDTPALEQALEPFQDRITYLRQPNRGVAAARNAGISLATGELLAFLDADDAWYPEFLASQVEFLRSSQFDMVYANALLFGDHPLAGLTYMDTTPSRGEVTLAGLLELRCHPITSGSIVSRRAVVDAGLFDQALQRGEDFHLWVRVAAAGGRIGYQRKTLLKYRIRPESLSRNVAYPVESDLAVFTHIKATVSLPPAESALVDRQIQRLQGIFAMERGKRSLALGRYHEAREHFRSAGEQLGSPKLLLARLMLFLSPALLQRLYALRRPDRSH